MSAPRIIVEISPWTVDAYVRCGSFEEEAFLRSLIIHCALDAAILRALGRLLEALDDRHEDVAA